MTVISSTRTRNPDGSWGGWSTTVEEPPATAQQPVTLVDPSDPQAMAEWRVGAAPVAGEAAEPVPAAADDARVWVLADHDTDAVRSTPMSTYAEVQDYLDDLLAHSEDIDARPLVITAGQYRAALAEWMREPRELAVREARLARAAAAFDPHDPREEDVEYRVTDAVASQAIGSLYRQHAGHWEALLGSRWVESAFVDRAAMERSGYVLVRVDGEGCDDGLVDKKRDARLTGRVLGILRQTDMSWEQRKATAASIVAAVRIEERDEPDTDADEGFAGDPNCPCIDGRCRCTTESVDPIDY